MEVAKMFLWGMLWVVAIGGVVLLALMLLSAPAPKLASVPPPAAVPIEVQRGLELAGGPR